MELREFLNYCHIKAPNGDTSKLGLSDEDIQLIESWPKDGQVIIHNVRRRDHRLLRQVLGLLPQFLKK